MVVFILHTRIYIQEMAGRSDQIAVPIGSDRDREKKDRSKIDRMIAIPLDQSYFLKIFKCFLAYTKFIIYIISI